jgi:phasin family protein
MADAKPARKTAPKTLKVVAGEKPVPAPKAVKPAAVAAPVVKAEVKAAAKPKPAPKATPAVAKAAPVLSTPIEPKDIPMNTEAFTKPLEAVVPAVEKAAADFVAQTQAAQDQMTGKVKEMMEKNMKTMTDMTDFAKGNVEALIESAKAAAAGAETLTTHFVETSKKSAEEAQAAFKSFTSAKTPNELMAAQNDFAKAQFDKAVANMSHFSETWLKLAGEVVQPISNRMAVAAETVKKTVAA